MRGWVRGRDTSQVGAILFPVVPPYRCRAGQQLGDCLYHQFVLAANGNF